MIGLYNVTTVLSEVEADLGETYMYDYRNLVETR